MEPKVEEAHSKVQEKPQEKQEKPEADKEKGEEPAPQQAEAQQQPVVKQEDKKSVFVENVDYGATKEELESIFKDCGKIVRVTILRDKYTNSPRGLAYVQFEDLDSVETAIMLTGTELRSRAIRVSQKRTNIKGMAKPKKKPMFQDNTSMLLKGLLEVFKPGGRKFGGGPRPKG